jgi:hypothetical protein
MGGNGLQRDQQTVSDRATISRSLIARIARTEVAWVQLGDHGDRLKAGLTAIHERHARPGPG